MNEYHQPVRLGTPKGQPLGVLRCYACGETVVAHKNPFGPCPTLDVSLLRVDRVSGQSAYHRVAHPFDHMSWRERYE